MSNTVTINHLNIPICTYEELQAIAASPLCLNCGHKEIIHSSDYEHGEHCYLCDCNRVIKEGDFSHWSPKSIFRSLGHDELSIYAHNSIIKHLNNIV